MYRKIGIGLVVLFTSLWGLEKTYDYFLSRNMNLKPAYITRHRIDADVIFLGPCEPLWMMDPDAFTKVTGLTAYNLATVHASFAENESMLHLYLDHNKAPKYIFLYVTTESLDGAFNVFNTYAFAPYLNQEWIAGRVAEEDSVYNRYRKLPFMKYGFYSDYVHFGFVQGVRHVWNKREEPYFKNGYVPPHDMVWDGRLERFIAQYPKGRHFNWNARDVKHLKAILEQARISNIQVILYESPMLNEVKPYILNREEIKQKITTFARENQVPYWVFDTMQISRSRDYFFSILNTNKLGSDIFNRTFAAYFEEKKMNMRDKTRFNQ
ncbi:MAG TPA: hypothetical protein VNZ86_05945 [Bacteroidia bacterium]|jgi:hypothetical protein|nr:hypothetical protein [Bacteroidia bacterium]